MNGLSRKIYLKLPLPTEDDPRSDQQRILDSLAVAGVEERVHITVHILRKLYPLLDNAKWKITVSLAWNGENWEMVEFEEGDTTVEDTWMGYVSDGDAVLAEPEDYMILR